MGWVVGCLVMTSAISSIRHERAVGWLGESVWVVFQRLRLQRLAVLVMFCVLAFFAGFGQIMRRSAWQACLRGCCGLWFIPSKYCDLSVLNPYILCFLIHLAVFASIGCARCLLSACPLSCFFIQSR